MEYRDREVKCKECGMEFDKDKNTFTDCILKFGEASEYIIVCPECGSENNFEEVG